MHNPSVLLHIICLLSKQMTLMMRVNDGIMLLLMPWFHSALIGRWWVSWIINVICLTVSLSRQGDYTYKQSSPSALIDRSDTILRITLEPAAPRMDRVWSELRKWKLCVWKLAVEECCTVGVGGPRWKLRERVSCSNREMFYAEGAITAERMK